jgi:hypothetical protein
MQAAILHVQKLIIKHKWTDVKPQIEVRSNAAFILIVFTQFEKFRSNITFGKESDMLA